jgi:hypothetical protein
MKTNFKNIDELGRREFIRTRRKGLLWGWFDAYGWLLYT